jgi:hypothetical protein
MFNEALVVVVAVAVAEVVAEVVAEDIRLNDRAPLETERCRGILCPGSG